jgi:hypothetical protein
MLQSIAVSKLWNFELFWLQVRSVFTGHGTEGVVQLMDSFYRYEDEGLKM